MLTYQTVQPDSMPSATLLAYQAAQKDLADDVIDENETKSAEGDEAVVGAEEEEPRTMLFMMQQNRQAASTQDEVS